MSGLQNAVCDREIRDAPEWVHLFPNGHMKGRDGRAFELADPAGLVLVFQANNVDLPVDYKHQNDRPEAKVSGAHPSTIAPDETAEALSLCSQLGILPKDLVP